ncbi:bifunctional tetrahydrofolate synthase/dihydrofolate synthase [Methylophaga pinxianii]|uniref:bifunctional tetrahydrofolate synthase/dihydrofolate synthase n=1 Tax=Methylophaga pinxianii TaxID=2881052 RepID=UPI001CF25756|nr:bifunctional tetrahydrofolate synthase/dihydrofolate synthase [Methylophaga pinxianii]MCB2427341.1 bifunctional tetrahydrofolate synthase/dihydrofolate synthase [Methylophaga pinxianii]UPH44360.1 bifunctional tetrahydrofolate synthase/dihydrofolate synthase [Methylophaga pinxianii]
MRFNSLPQWLAWQEKLHFTEIDPGLDRIRAVWQQMYADKKLPFRVVTVAGTNGKGSSVALLASILSAAGYRTACYTSPHLLRYNERIVVDGQPATDLQICEAFDRIDTARGDVSLSYFEFATLAAADIFCRQDIDIAILEVGMGGRLDAVNLFDADIALITPIGLDHTVWLGDTRELIGIEKAGIMRAQHPVVCSESSPPSTVIEIAHQLAAPAYIAAKDFTYQSQSDVWHWQNKQYQFDALPHPALLGCYQFQNSAAVLQVISLLKDSGMTKITETAIRNGLQQVRLAGRFQKIDGPVTHIFDVTHNQQGAENLAKLLREISCEGKTHAVIAMLRDKDSRAVFDALLPVIDNWFIGGLTGDRGQSAEDLAAGLQGKIANDRVHLQDTVEQAYNTAAEYAVTGDRILIFGSFHTVEAIMRHIPEFINEPLSVSA